MKSIISILVSTFLLLSLSFIPVALADNSDIAVQTFSNTTLINVTSNTYVDIYNNQTNLSVSAKGGTVLLFILAEARTNFSNRALNVQIMSDSGEVINANVTSSTLFQTVPIIFPNIIVVGNHNYSLFFKVDNGSFAQIRKLSFEVLLQPTSINFSNIVVNGTPLNNLNASNLTVGTIPNSVYGTGILSQNISNFGTSVNNTVDKNLSNYTNSPNYTTNTTAQIGEGQVTNLNNDLTNNQNINNVQNTSITGLQNNDTSDRSYVNNTFERLSNKSTNTGLGTSDLLYPTQNAVKTYADTKQSTLSTGSTGQFLGWDLAMRDPNATVNPYTLNWSNVTQNKPSTFPNTTLGNHETNLDYPNTSLQTQINGKEPAISSGSATQFWAYNKTFISLVSSYITDFVSSVRSQMSSSSGLISYNSGTGVISDNINNSAQLGGISQVTGLQGTLNQINNTESTDNATQSNQINTKTTLSQVNSSAQITEAQVTNLVNDLNSKFNSSNTTDNLTQGLNNKYFSNALARAAVSNGTSSDLIFNTSSGIFDIKLPSCTGNNFYQTSDGANFSCGAVSTYNATYDAKGNASYPLNGSNMVNPIPNASIPASAGNTSTTNTWQNPQYYSKTIQLHSSQADSILGIDITNGGPNGPLVIVNNTIVQPLSTINDFSGLLIIDDTVTGNIGLFLLGGGNIIIVSQTGVGFTTTKDTPGKINVYLSSLVTNIQNLGGITVNLYVFSLRTRASQ